MKTMKLTSDPPPAFEAKSRVTITTTYGRHVIADRPPYEHWRARLALQIARDHAHGADAITLDLDGEKWEWKR
jgi:hypothetical protein